MDNTEVRVEVKQDEAWFRHIKYSVARPRGYEGERRRKKRDEFGAWNALRRLVGVLVSFASCISIEAYINHPGCIL